mmetsp:Transcript_4929/g.8561  ORF Transcript_4929/g.8561 Transcript_4929/m.8561 type:complete len:204 (-) Transcript_4929:1251-1862(-)|eukprot:CAMPEP_0119107620 /NCGR_PEP_ID=MMETSP1180-20130426/11507_1 /TAXON_ID=3052 ORGANISM="Chlamydomonas cf sp, Strain CCMP681" /NCGR_SAMPLE_ID=MMETSP1180 /ASSEMBLY_ACC=CAM_ASM_000741 /LENGTH=203 /DNA_ID=CAMNT_0007093137 /DNA_START=75 /DNA_END=686 /DNA_ORIENTATION=+
MSSSASPGKRRDMDVMKLLMTDHGVELVDECMSDFNVMFHGPPGSPYEGGVWKVHVELPEAYPYKSPSIGFTNRIYHPNVDEGRAGSVCLDVINQTWSPMFDLVNIFEVFLPQLLLYPNPADPLNGEAAAMLMRDPKAYAAKVKDYVQRYARPDIMLGKGAAAHAANAATKGKASEDGEDGKMDHAEGEESGGFLSSSDDGDS